MRRVLAICLALAVSSAVTPRAAADDKDAVVVSVGTAKLSVAEVERRLRAVPPFQLHEFGTKPEEIKKNFVDKVLVPELLLSEEAKRRGIDKTPPASDRIREALRMALDAELRDATGSVTPAELQAYYDANKSRFNTPKRIKLWRILAKDEAGAKKILADVKGNDVAAASLWNKLARDSLDAATRMRDGDLGFVSSDGQTEVPQVRIDPALFAAADKVKDGELVPEPVKEGEGFAVVWRRGSLEAVTRTLEQETPSIRQIVSRQKLADALNELGTKLREQNVKNVSYELLNYVSVSVSGDVGTRQRPGVIPRQRARGSAAPERDERGLR